MVNMHGPLNMWKNWGTKFSASKIWAPKLPSQVDMAILSGPNFPSEKFCSPIFSSCSVTPCMLTMTLLPERMMVHVITMPWVKALQSCPNTEDLWVYIKNRREKKEKNAFPRSSKQSRFLTSLQDTWIKARLQCLNPWHGNGHDYMNHHSFG